MLPLNRKIGITQSRIIEWYQRYDGKVYISFSGGKDSTVLLDIVRKIYPDVPAIFLDTGLEYPEIRDFVKTKENVTWLVPEKYNREKKQYERYTFKEVLNDYGYPLISKEQAAFIQEYRTTKSEKLKDIRWNGNKSGRGKISPKWRPLVDAPFIVSDKCCDVMKKRPAHKYEKETGNYPIIATMADESAQRKSNWLMYGCNAFDTKRPTSRPMSFWTEQDVLNYITTYDIPYASVYGDIVEDQSGKLKTTLCDRTGCVFCGFGCQCEKEPNRFQRLKVTHPKLHEFCMKPKEEGGLGMKEVLDYINVKSE
ncbi:MAG: phosphoadenosine phosphosulfate reductase family protein [Bacteroidaceae bacterium]